MKNINYFIKTIVLIFTISVICSSFTGCDLFVEESDKCKNSEISEITLKVYPNVTVWFDEKDENGNYIPAGEVDVTLNIHKEYCSGKHAGAYEASATSNALGYVNFGWTYEYKFSNMDDVVFYSLIFTRGDNRREINGEISANEANMAPKDLMGHHYFNIKDHFPADITLYWDYEE